jgi:uncharacterized protein (TIGR01777 family)
VRVGITGSSGFLGTAIADDLARHGHDVVRFVRSHASAPDQRRWDGTHLAPDQLHDLEAVVHLSGAGLGEKRWSPSYKKEIRDSRVLSTAAVARAVAHSHNEVRVLVSASAAGYYGDTGEELVGEWSPPGSGFLAEVCRDWEAATAPAESHARVVHLRTGVVLGKGGGALGRQVPLFKAGLGAPLGSGRQWLSWISLTDHAAAVRHVLTTDDVTGPVNLVAPEPVTNRDFTKALGPVLHRPTWPVGVPRQVLHLVLGEFADDVLASFRIAPTVLERTHFAYSHPDLPSALQAAVAG